MEENNGNEDSNNKNIKDNNDKFIDRKRIAQNGQKVTPIKTSSIVCGSEKGESYHLSPDIILSIIFGSIGTVIAIVFALYLKFKKANQYVS